MKQSSNISWKAIERSRGEYYRMAEKLFYKALNEQIDPLLSKLNNGNMVAPDIVSSLISEDPVKQRFNYVYQKTGGDYAVGIRNSFDMADELRSTFNAYFANYVNQYAGEKITSITAISAEYAEKIIRSVLAEAGTGLGEGELSRLIGKELMKGGAKINNWRARVIARTEVAAASNIGQQVGAESIGQPMKKRWLATMDDRVRDRHAEMNGKTVDINGTFQVGSDMMQTPGDMSASVENVVNCRCALQYFVI